MFPEKHLRAGHKLVVLNAVDDQLYFSTDDNMRKWFEEKTKQRFHVQTLGQAHWYLQARITQHENFDITLDQSRYAASIGAKYLRPLSPDQITEALRKKYATPLPVGCILSLKDCSKYHTEVLDLNEEFGFEFAAAVGSLMYLSNTYVKGMYAIRKLARFMSLPGRAHYKALKHLLHHVQYHHTSAGIRYYADPSLSPLTKRLKEIEQEWVAEHPIVVVSDSSFQDCPDTSRSTGGYMIMVQGGVVGAASFMPSLITHSTGEAEYCTAAMALMAASSIRKIYNELNDRDADAMLTIPLGIDSQAARDIAASPRETKRTRHMQRRFHYLREAVQCGYAITFAVAGVSNWSNCLTKLLSRDMLKKETEVFHVEVPP